MRARQVSPREEFSGPAHLGAVSMLTGYALRTWRARQGVTLAEMARALDCTDGHLSRVERGARLGPTPGHAAAALGIPATQFLIPCPHCHWNPADGSACEFCGTAQSARQVADEIVSWITRGGM